MRRIVIIGGGAAGMTAAYFAKAEDTDVIICERNEKLGKKLFITGKGRCNLTNNCEVSDFFENIPTNSKFLLSAVYGFTPQDVMQLFSETAKIPLKTERGGRVFPVSDKSSDVIKGFQRLLAEKKVNIRLNTRVTGIKTEDGRVRGVFTGAGFIPADAVIIAAGGLSYPSTGSTGDGYEFAQRAGHTITPLAPGLVGIVTRGAGALIGAQGLTLKNAGFYLLKKDKEVFGGVGEVLITHFGVSGPLALSASSHIKGDPKEYEVKIDLKPALDAKKLDARLLRDFEERKNRSLKNMLTGLMPKSLIEPFLQISGLNGEKSVNSVTKEERALLAETLKSIKSGVVSLRGIEEAIITRGGVSVKEISPATMESKKVSGLYFAGEIIDTDGYTGGFNLQIALSTGHLAGISAAVRVGAG